MTTTTNSIESNNISYTEKQAISAHNFILSSKHSFLSHFPEAASNVNELTNSVLAEYLDANEDFIYPRYEALDLDYDDLERWASIKDWLYLVDKANENEDKTLKPSISGKYLYDLKALGTILGHGSIGQTIEYLLSEHLSGAIGFFNQCAKDDLDEVIED